MLLLLSTGWKTTYDFKITCTIITNKLCYIYFKSIIRFFFNFMIFYPNLLIFKPNLLMQNLLHWTKNSLLIARVFVFFVSCVAALKRLPVHHYSAGYTFIFFRIIGLIVVSLKIKFCSCIEGVSSVANLTTAYEESQQTETPFFYLYVFFVSKGNHLDFYYERLIAKTM